MGISTSGRIILVDFLVFLVYDKTMAKKWPKNDKCADFADIAKPLREAFKTFAPDQDWTGSTLKRSHKWNGLPFGPGVSHVVPDPWYLLSREGLDSALDQGCDALDTLIQIAINLGFEQGRRHEVTANGRYIKVLESSLETMQSLHRKLKEPSQ